MTYYLALADATLAIKNDEVETDIVGPFDTIKDARDCLVKMIRHFFNVMWSDYPDDHKNLDDDSIIKLFNKQQNGCFWFINEGEIRSPTDFVNDYCRRRVLVSREDIEANRRRGPQ